MIPPSSKYSLRKYFKRLFTKLGIIFFTHPSNWEWEFKKIEDKNIKR